MKDPIAVLELIASIDAVPPSMLAVCRTRRLAAVAGWVVGR